MKYSLDNLVVTQHTVSPIPVENALGYWWSLHSTFLSNWIPKVTVPEIWASWSLWLLYTTWLLRQLNGKSKYWIGKFADSIQAFGSFSALPLCSQSAHLAQNWTCHHSRSHSFVTCNWSMLYWCGHVHKSSELAHHLDIDTARLFFIIYTISSHSNSTGKKFSI